MDEYAHAYAYNERATNYGYGSRASFVFKSKENCGFQNVSGCRYVYGRAYNEITIQLWTDTEVKHLSYFKK